MELIEGNYYSPHDLQTFMEVSESTWSHRRNELLLAPGENRHFEPGENSQFQPGRNRQSVPGGCSQPRFECRF